MQAKYIKSRKKEGEEGRKKLISFAFYEVSIVGQGHIRVNPKFILPSVSEVGAGLQGTESTAVIQHTQSVLSDMGRYISQAL